MNPSFEKFTDVKKASMDSSTLEKEMMHLLENSIMKSSEEHVPTVIPDESSDDEE